MQRSKIHHFICIQVYWQIFHGEPEPKWWKASTKFILSLHLSYLVNMLLWIAMHSYPNVSSYQLHFWEGYEITITFPCSKSGEKLAFKVRQKNTKHAQINILQNLKFKNNSCTIPPVKNNRTLEMNWKLLLMLKVLRLKAKVYKGYNIKHHVIQPQEDAERAFWLIFQFQQ